MDETQAEHEARIARMHRRDAALLDRGPDSLRQAIYNAFAPVIAEPQDDRRPGDGVLSSEQALLRSGGVLLRALALARLRNSDEVPAVGGMCAWTEFTEDDLAVGVLAVAGFLEGGAVLLQKIEDADDSAPRGKP